jgi:EPS-associated MarR family transcriptional regulator
LIEDFSRHALPATRHRIEAKTVIEEIYYKVIKQIEQDAEISQRELSKELGVSLGKVNYCLHALIDKGWVKAKIFKNKQNKLAYRYLLTPTGMQQKAFLTKNFLKMKIGEYENLQLEIEGLRKEVTRLPDEG